MLELPEILILDNSQRIKHTKKLMDLDVGDTGRIEYMITLGLERELYQSDRKYLEDMIKKYNLLA